MASHSRVSASQDRIEPIIAGISLFWTRFSYDHANIVFCEGVALDCIRDLFSTILLLNIFTQMISKQPNFQVLAKAYSARILGNGWPAGKILFFDPYCSSRGTKVALE